MEHIELCANAKLNLSLDIVGRRDDGYHLMDMIMQSIDLSDRVDITRTPGQFSVSSDLPFLPSDMRNSACKAAMALAAAVGRERFDCAIHIQKTIPSQAGMGGGTADAAAVLIGLDRLFELGLSADRLAAVAPAVGADVPFCLTGGTARVRGIGEQIEPLPPLRGVCFVVAMPHRGSSTKKAFARFDEAPAATHPDTDAVADAIRRGDTAALAAGCRNVFSPIVVNDEMAALMQAMRSRGALAAEMTGSGSAVFGLFDDEAAARRCQAALRRRARRCFFARPAVCGVSVEKEG